MGKRTILFVSLLLLCVVGLPSAEYPRPRYVSLAPATTEILFAIGLDEEIVAVSTYCNYPPAALAKEKIGSFSEPNIEKIISLKPTLVFATGLEQATTVQRLKRLGIKVCLSDPPTFEALFSSIVEIGKKTGREEAAGRLIQDLKERIAQVEQKVSKIPLSARPRVFVEIWHAPLLTAGRGSIVEEIVAAAGGINIAHDTPRPYSYFSPEQVIARDPDCIILGHRQGEKSSVNSVYRRSTWQGVAAVRHRRVYDIDPDILLRPGPRIVDCLETLYKRLYEQ